MKLQKSTHKVFLYNLFFQDTMGGRSQKSFGLQVLSEASSSFKKLLQGSEVRQEGTLTYTTFSEEEVEFTIDEAKFLKDLLASKTEATVQEYEVLQELKELFV